MNGSESAVLQTAPSVVTGNSTSNDRPTVSTRLATMDDKSSSRGTKRAIEGRGYSGTLGATVSERMLMFSNASSGSRSNSPMPLPKEEKSKRVLRQGWIKKELPKNDDDNVTKITECSGIEGTQRLKDKQTSPVQGEKPPIVANIIELHHASSNDSADDGSIEKMNIESTDNGVLLSLQKDETSDGISNSNMSSNGSRIPLQIIVPSRRESSSSTAVDDNLSPEFGTSSEPSSSDSKVQKNVIPMDSEIFNENKDEVCSSSLSSTEKECSMEGFKECSKSVEEEVTAAPPSVSMHASLRMKRMKNSFIRLISFILYT